VTKESIRKGPVVFYFQIINQHLPGKIKEGHENPSVGIALVASRTLNGMVG
jgi:hypothetical protein